MVGHTHQDFLGATDILPGLPDKYGATDLSDIKEFDEEFELFDIPGKRFRKVSISYLDEHLDGIDDWNRFIRPLIGIDCLFLVNDRDVSNPIMREFANNRNQRYLSQLNHDKIPALIVTA